jgi:hypothetical protein
MLGSPMMSYWILPISCHVISCTTVQKLTLLDQQQNLFTERCQHFDMTVKEKLRDSNHIILLNSDEQPHDWENFAFSKDKDFLCEYGKKLALEDPTIPETDRLHMSTPDSYDPYVNMELSLPRGQDSTMEFARVLKRKTDSDGNLIGIANANPILDSRMYVVEWSDGRTEELMANMIAENIFSQVDDEGKRYVLLDDTIDHRNTEGYTSGDDGFITRDNGMKQRRQANKGWELCLQWKAHYANRIKLKDVKNAYPIVQLPTKSMKNLPLRGG